jgi:broad specificity phosphatase PhoE
MRLNNVHPGRRRMKIIAVGHGETQSTITGKLIGWLDEELTSKGREEASRLAGGLPEEVVVIVSLPLPPALQTAKIVAGLSSCRIMVDANLGERNFGSLAGES